MNKKSAVRNFFLLFAAGLLFGLAAAVAGLAAPAIVFPNSEWFDGGIRLFRDDRELRYFYNHGAWISRNGIPYSQAHPQEYPPLGVIFFSLPRLFTDDFRKFGVFFAILTVSAYILVARRNELVLLVLAEVLIFIQFPVLFGIDPFSWTYNAVSAARSIVLLTLFWLNFRQMRKEGTLIFPLQLAKKR